VLNHFRGRFSPDGRFQRPAPRPRAGSYVHVAVHDNGSGMPPAVPSASSKPFFTTSPPAKAPGSVCQSCTYHAEHGGRLPSIASPAKEPLFTSISRFPRKPTGTAGTVPPIPSSPDAASGSCSSTTRWSSRGHFCACLVAQLPGSRLPRTGGGDGDLDRRSRRLRLAGD